MALIVSLLLAFFVVVIFRALVLKGVFEPNTLACPYNKSILYSGAIDRL